MTRTGARSTSIGVLASAGDEVAAVANRLPCTAADIKTEPALAGTHWHISPSGVGNGSTETNSRGPQRIPMCWGVSGYPVGLRTAAWEVALHCGHSVFPENNTQAARPIPKDIKANTP